MTPSERKLPAISRTKVLMLTDSFMPHAGGSREYYNNIYRALVELGGSEVTILTKKIPGWRKFDDLAASSLFRVRRQFRPLRSWKYRELPKGVGPFLQAVCHVLRYWSNIVHAGDLYPQGVTAIILKKLLRLPYIVYCHGEEITQTDKYRYQPGLRDRVYKNADAVIANSEFARQNLMRIGVNPDRICKITPGVDAKRFRPRPPNIDLLRRYGLEGKTVILTVARLVPRKGHRIALQAFASVCDEFPDAHYLIAGTGPEEGYLRQFAKTLGVHHRVSFAGFVPSETLPDLYNLCELMLLANRQEADGDVEGFGIVFLEANAAGKPVIGGRSGGAIEAIVDDTTGCLVNPDDAVDVGNALRRLLSDQDLRARMGAAGARRVAQEFTWAERAQLLEDLNRRVLTRTKWFTDDRNNRMDEVSNDKV
jgi:phosphatidylinositol alpha-1,6-mannosyltransferase